MTWPAAFDPARLDLLVEGRISQADASRQMATAAELLHRLGEQPGVVLADEVGMGKTFVALAVAFSAMWADKGKRPVVILVPTSVEEKWKRDLEVFCKRCLRRDDDRAFRWAQAENALDFFRLLDDPVKGRKRLIFLSHGAFHRRLQDPWVKLAILKFAMHGARLGNRKREAICRYAPDILHGGKGAFNDPDLAARLIAADFDRWRDIIGEDAIDDDPVPAALVRALHQSELDVSALRDTLREMPERESKHIDDRLLAVRRTLNASFQGIWRAALAGARFRSPLLILDEAHHVKNPATRLASLFVSDEARADADLVSVSGALEGGFERMLFLTATPFQLGHHELLNVIGRFQGIDWKSLPGLDHATFLARVEALEESLDEAQRAAVDLDWKWGRLRPSDVPPETELDDWWQGALASEPEQPQRIQEVIRAFRRAEAALRAAEGKLRPWVLRHLRPRALVPGSGTRRRTRLCGYAIRTQAADERNGIPISDGALLPFLLAARAQAVVAHLARVQRDQRIYRATFAEGLASSYEAFLETRAGTSEISDEALEGAAPSDPRLQLYLERLRGALPNETAFAEHPKIAATTARAVELWAAGEKVVVFCHYRRTGRALVRHISSAIDRHLWDSACRRLGVDPAEARRLTESWDDGFDLGRPLDRALRDSIGGALDAAGGLPDGLRTRVIDIARRFLRTPLFLLRFVDLAADDRPAALTATLTGDHEGGLSLRARIESFARFFAERLTDGERTKYLDALERIQPGGQQDPFDPSEDHGGAVRLPTVRLASGAVKPDLRERLLLGFNTPFFPEVLVASSVMAEGVDLHLNCRHMIHHDLDWNPSTLEQRTGRIDRIGARCEQVARTIEVYLPYLGGTQDEKMYRVVTDRERWFGILMGDSYPTDEHATEAAAARLTLPGSAVETLTLRLDYSVPMGRLAAIR